MYESNKESNKLARWEGNFIIKKTEDFPNARVPLTGLKSFAYRV